MRSIEDLQGLLSRLSADPGEAVRSAADLSDLVASLEPPAMGIASRPHFERASEYAFPMVFEHVGADAIVGPKSIVASWGDVWVRGLTATCFPLIYLPEGATFAARADRLQRFRWDLGPEWRALFDLEYEIDGKHGFVSDGFADLQGDARELTGDGEAPVPLDWTLQRDQVIQVKLHSKLAELNLDAGGTFPTFAELRYVVVCFWAKDLSARGR